MTAGKALLGLLLAAATAGAAAAELQVAGDAIERPLAAPGDVERGRAIVASRRTGLCLLCHPAPLPEPNLHGDLAPSLAGVGSRLSEGQLRLRVADARRLNPTSVMPSYFGGTAREVADARVAPAFAGRPVLDAQQVEDVVAFLRTLR